MRLWKNPLSEASAAVPKVAILTPDTSRGAKQLPKHDRETTAHLAPWELTLE